MGAKHLGHTETLSCLPGPWKQYKVSWGREYYRGVGGNMQGRNKEGGRGDRETKKEADHQLVPVVLLPLSQPVDLRSQLRQLLLTWLQSPSQSPHLLCQHRHLFTSSVFLQQQHLSLYHLETTHYSTIIKCMLLSRPVASTDVSMKTETPSHLLFPLLCAFFHLSLKLVQFLLTLLYNSVNH